jgi:lipopolysaccharide transport system ATP-binding protein
MSDDVLIKVDNLSKKFCRDLKQSLWYGMKDITDEVLGRKHKQELRDNEFWSVSDISFEVKRGECLGLIGPNGAGKSTLLKMLNGLLKPDKGRIEMRGRINALIELSAGFNPILTGRENIYARGTILGFSKADIDRKINSIIEFSELAEFIDTPVINYSSGMRVRLGFAIAAQMEPDVMLLDEVLAVGDIGFRAKCFNTIYEKMQTAAVILVSHNMPQISRVCSDIIVMEHGHSVFQGKNVSKGIDKFYSYFSGEKNLVMGSGRATIHQINLVSNGRKDLKEIEYLDELSIHIDVSVDADIKKSSIDITIINQELQNVVMCNSKFNGVEFENSGEVMHIVANIGKVNLNPGNYSLSVTVYSENNIASALSFGEVLCKHYNCKNFRVTGGFFGWAPVQIVGDWQINETKALNEAQL